MTKHIKTMVISSNRLAIKWGCAFGIVYIITIKIRRIRRTAWLPRFTGL